jgi:tetratricopeptide (TPR) repeat protein
VILDRWLDTENRYKDSTLHVPLRTNEVRYLLAVMKERAGQTNEAIRLYRETLENDAGLYMAHVRLAGIYEGHGMWDQAIAERQHAVDANPDDASLVLDLGVTQAKAGRGPDAAKNLQQAMEANPRDVRAAYYLGVLSQQLDRKTDARTALTSFLSAAPSRFQRQIEDARQRLSALQ